MDLIEPLETPAAKAFMSRHAVQGDAVEDDERKVLRHALTGSTGTDEVYRNYFAAGPGHSDLTTIERLVLRGLMYVGNNVPGAGSSYYHCTAKGARAVGLRVQEPWATQQRGV
jgi:hypothetical protein